MGRTNESEFRHLERMMKRRPDERKKGVHSCSRCEFFQPDFKYRRCLFSKCIYGVEENVFRKKPLKKDRFAKK